MQIDEALHQFETVYLPAGGFAAETRRKYLAEVRTFLAFLAAQGVDRADRIGLVEFRYYLAHLDGKGLAASTRRRHVYAIRREEPSGSGHGEALFHATGPICSLASAAILGYLGTSAAEDSTLAQIFMSGSYGAILQLLVTIVPVRYPSWLGAYAGYLSDGAMILRCLRGEYPVSRV